MEVSPQSVRSSTFKTVRKGFDPDEVNAFKDRVAGAIETAQNQAAAMEARARAAVAKLQEVSQQTSAPEPVAVEPTITATVDEEATISRTLLLAQHTADRTMATAEAKAGTVTSEAQARAKVIVDEARAAAAATVDQSRDEARRAGDEERTAARNEVQALLARRDFLLSDVDHLEQYVAAQRERLRDAAVSLHELVERVPGGLGEMRRPLLSASADAESPAMESDDVGAAPADTDSLDDSTVDDSDSTVASTDDEAPASGIDVGSASSSGGGVDIDDITGEIPVIEAEPNAQLRIIGDDFTR